MDIDQPGDVAGGTAYRWTTITTADAQAWADLVNHLALVDGTEEFLSPEDLLEELGSATMDPERDTVAVWEGEQMVAYTTTGCPLTLDHEGRARTFVGGGVHQEHRGRGLGRTLMDRAEDRCAELAAARHPGVPAYIRCSGGLDGSSARGMFEARGYAVVRWFNLLARPGDLPVAEGAERVPAGLELVSPAEEHREPTRATHNLAFRDHWGSGEISEASWDEMWTSRSARPGLSTLAVDEHGAVLAYVLAGKWVDQDLYLNLVGTHPDARGQGLAAACLSRTVRLAAEQGYRVVELHVDSDSPTGATRLYERVGFALKHRSASMSRPLPVA